MKKHPIICYNGNIESINESKKTPHYFAASNSSKGFLSYFGDVFGERDVKRIYVLLGGPGSGKSTMMKKLASVSEKEGYTTERIHCSSSPFSLDGVIVKEKCVAVIDGTNPHTYEMSHPGVREIVVDPGLAWDTDKLYENRDEIIKLSQEKKAAYRKAYLFLRASGLMSSEMKELVKPCVSEEKLKKNVDLQIRSVLPKKSNTAFSRTVRLQSAICGLGNIYFESLYRSADKKILVKDSYGISEIYFRHLYDKAVENKAKVTVSYSAENPEVIDGILFEDTSVCFSLYCNENECDKIINCERFENKNAMSVIKQKYGFAAKCKYAIDAQAHNALLQAAQLHERIEEKYAPCTDYSITEKISSELCQRIFG